MSSGVASARPFGHPLGVVIKRLADGGVLSSEAGFSTRDPGYAISKRPPRVNVVPMHAKTVGLARAKRTAWYRPKRRRAPPNCSALSGGAVRPRRLQIVLNPPSN